MKIAAYCHAYIPVTRGGAERMLLELMRALASAGHDCEVLCNHPAATSHVDQDVRVFFGSLAATRKRKSRPDVVITQLAAAAEASRWSEEVGARLVVVAHNTNRQTRDYIDNKPDLIVYNTEWLARFWGMPGIVVHPPVWRRDHETADSGSRVTLVNLMREKGAGVFYKAAERLPKINFLGVKGGYGEQIIRPQPNISIIETTDDMKNDVWRKSRLVIMPSSYESYGMVAAEACMSGIPVIAAPTDGLRECLGPDGLFIDPSDTTRWVLEIRRHMTDDGYWQKRSEAARRRGEQIRPERELAAFVAAIEAL